ncbi:MAG: hypothetical protein ABFD89_06640 [Bryobacteraceae bacterium]
MALDYIAAGSKPTAAQMNLLWAEFDRKLTKILYGKSFLLSRIGQFPASLMGKIFYFTPVGFEPIYALRSPGIGVNPGGVVLGPDGNPLPPTPASVMVYDHSVFTARLAAIQADITATPSHATWDDANRIVTVPLTPDSAYGLYPHETTDGFGDRPMGFFDHSLQAHYLMHQAAGDTEPQKYYVREHGAVPEKIYKYALAELVIEGQSTLAIPDAYNKYNFFRIHNLSQTPCVVSFSTHYTVTVAPFGCATVRRDSVTTNYRTGWNYFFKFEKGDPRMFWFHATQQNLPNYPALPLIGGSTQMRVSNTMTANNLCNPAMIHDWIGAMAIPESWLALYSAVENAGWGAMDLGGTGDIRYAWFQRDTSIVYDAYAENSKQFGDPSKPATLLGDLIHHTGTIIIARTSRTVTDPATGKLQVTWDTMQFKGYATIVADFAAHGITVAENADGDLTFVNAHTDICDLIPIGTNLFKKWNDTNAETFPPIVPLHDTWDQNTPYGGGAFVTADCQIFESLPGGISPAPFVLRNQAPPAVFQRNLQTSANTRQWQDYNNPADNYGHTVTVTGPNIQNIIVPNPVATKVLHGIHKTTVADILSLVWWGNPALSDQGTAYVTYTNKKLTLTDQGLVLSFDTTITGIEPAPRANGGGNNGMAFSGDQLYWRTGKLKRKQVITFRGHGWGHAAQGSKSMAFMAPRSGKRMIQRYITNEISGPNGADFGVQPPGSSETAHKVLQRMKLSDLGLPDKAARFWRNTGRDIDVFLKHYQTPGWYGRVHSPPSGTDTQTPGYIDYYGNPSNMMGLTDSDVFLLPLDIEHYNGMAAAVNSLVTGFGLTCAALAWRVGGKILSLTPTQDNLPVPTDCFAAFPGGASSQSFGSGNADTLALCQYLGITIRTALPNDVMSFAAVPQTGCVIATGTITGTCTAFEWTVTYNCNVAMTLNCVDAAAQALGGGAGTWDPTTARPAIPGALGTYYVCSNAGWDGAEFWMKGDLLAWFGDTAMVFDPYPDWVPVFRHLSCNAGQAGSAVIAQTGQGVQLTPEPPAPALGHLCCARSLGTWTPPTLPAAATQPGDYYTIGSTVRPNYFAGSRIVWNGTNWQVANSSYADFNWVSIADVTTFMATLGFPMVFNELVIPLSLGFEAMTGAAAGPAQILSATFAGTVVAPPGNFYPAGNVGGPSCAFSQGGISARNQFSTNKDGGWKMRISPYALYNSGAKLANVKDYTNHPPNFIAMLGYAGCATYGSVNGTPIYTASLDLGIGGFPGTLYGALAPVGNEKLFQCGISEDPAAYWQYVQYGVRCANSGGTVQASAFTIVPIGLWNHDGDYWAADTWSFEKAAFYGVSPYKYFGAAGAPTTITPANGLTLLPSPGQCGADLLFNINVNAIALDEPAAAAPSIDTDSTPIDSDSRPIDT